MKAKEYYATYFADVDTYAYFDTSEFEKAHAECFSAVLKEAQAAAEDVRSTQSKLAKLKEGEKKWAAIVTIIEKRMADTLLLTGNPGLLSRMKNTFKAYFIKQHPLKANQLGY